MTNEKLMELLTTVGKSALLLAVCLAVMAVLLRLTTRLFQKTKLDSGVQGFLRSALKVALWILTLLIVADSLGIPVNSIIAILSVATLALSLSLQNILTNVFSGISRLISRPFVAGDFVEIGGVSGTVKELTIMRTSLDAPDNRLILIPNADVAAAKITNFSTEPLRRVDLQFTASYDAPTELVKQALLEVIRADSRVKTDPAPFVALSGYNANDIAYTIRCWVDNPDYWPVHFALNEAVREAFARHGIEFSYPHTVVHIDKGE